MAGTPVDADHSDAPVVTLHSITDVQVPPADRRLPGGKAPMTGPGFVHAVMPWDEGEP
jgi:hypothetical protein